MLSAVRSGVFLNSHVIYDHGFVDDLIFRNVRFV